MTAFSKIAAIMAFGVSSLSVAHAEELRIGHVSMNKIMRESQQSKAADAKLKKESSKREKELASMLDKLKKKAAKFEKDAPVLADSERAKRQQELADLDRDLKQKGQAARQELAQMQNEELAAFSKQLEQAVKKVAAAEKLDLIVQDATYVNPKLDVTAKVLEELNN